MKKIEHKPESSCVSEPAMVYYRKPSKEMEFFDDDDPLQVEMEPLSKEAEKYLDMEIRIGLEQIERGEVIPAEEVFAKYFEPLSEASKKSLDRAIQISLEQADRGELIPLEEVLATYK